MATTVTIRDGNLAGETLQQWSLELLTERLTLRELIRSRVYQEVQDYNRRQPERFLGLIAPTDDERMLNGPRSTQRRPIDWNRQFERAVEAVRKQQVLVFVNDCQVEDLDQELEIQPGSEVSFMRLTMLTGG
jgi:hypothetical protein